MAPVPPVDEDLPLPPEIEEPPVNQSGQNCVAGPITICTIKPPPPDPFMDPDPFKPVSPPSINWSLCSVFGIFCTAQEPLPKPQPHTSDEQVALCMEQYDADMDECRAYRRATDARTYRACKERAANYLSQCLKQARSGG